MTNHKYMTAFLAVLLLPNISLSQEFNSVTNNYPMMDKIVVTGTRYDEKITSIPAYVSVIDQADIDNSTAINIPELLKSHPGLHVYDLSGNKRKYRVDVRSFGETAQSNTLVLVDGRRINQPDLSGTDWAVIPLERVEKIEIMRGGRGSVLYGDNAAGGVINIITKRGEKKVSTASVSASSFATLNTSAFTGGTTDKLDYGLTASYMNSNGYRDNSGVEGGDFGLNLGYLVNDNIAFKLKGGYHKENAHLPGALKVSDFANGLSRTETVNPLDFANTKDHYIEAGSEIYFLNDSQLNLDVSYRERDFTSFASFAGGTFDAETTLKSIAFSPELIIQEKIIGLDNSLVAGFDYSEAEEDITNSSIFFGFPSSDTFDMSKDNYGFYIHDEFVPFENLTISGGFRHDRAEYNLSNISKSKFNNAVMDEELHTFGINYILSGNSQIYASYSKSFRYPVIDELFDFFTNSIISLVPQTSKDWEVGIKHAFTDTLTGNLNIFRIDTENEIFYNASTFMNSNLDGESRREGFEIVVLKKLASWQLGASYTYTEAGVRDGQFVGKDVPAVPEHKATLEGKYTFESGLSAGINGNYIGSRFFESDFDNSFTKQLSHFVLNAKIKYSWGDNSVYVDINNITDEEYFEYGVLGGFPVEQAFYPSPDMNFKVGLNLAF